jgi:hypothetical protein
MDDNFKSLRDRQKYIEELQTKYGIKKEMADDLYNVKLNDNKYSDESKFDEEYNKIKKRSKFFNYLCVSSLILLGSIFAYDTIYGNNDIINMVKAFKSSYINDFEETKEIIPINEIYVTKNEAVVCGIKNPKYCEFKSPYNIKGDRCVSDDVSYEELRVGDIVNTKNSSQFLRIKEIDNEYLILQDDYKKMKDVVVSSFDVDKRVVMLIAKDMEFEKTNYAYSEDCVKFNGVNRYSTFTDTRSMIPTFGKDAVALQKDTKLKWTVKEGDIVTFSFNNNLTIHRIVDINKNKNGVYYTFKGDNLYLNDPVDIKKNELVSKTKVIIY